jgi:hypothetical protein
MFPPKVDFPASTWPMNTMLICSFPFVCVEVSIKPLGCLMDPERPPPPLLLDESREDSVELLFELLLAADFDFVAFSGFDGDGWSWGIEIPASCFE